MGEKTFTNKKKEGECKCVHIERKDKKENGRMCSGLSTVVPPFSLVIYVSSWQQAFRKRGQH